MYPHAFCKSEGFESRIDYLDDAISNDPETQRAWNKISGAMEILRQALIRIQAPPSIIDQLDELDDYITELVPAITDAIAKADEVELSIMLGKMYSSSR